MKIENIKKAKDLEWEYKYFVESKAKYEKMLDKDYWRHLDVRICGEDTHFEEKYIKLLIKKEIAILDKKIKELEQQINEID